MDPQGYCSQLMSTIAAAVYNTMDWVGYGLTGHVEYIVSLIASTTVCQAIYTVGSSRGVTGTGWSHDECRLMIVMLQVSHLVYKTYSPQQFNDCAEEIEDDWYCMFGRSVMEILQIPAIVGPRYVFEEEEEDEDEYVYDYGEERSDNEGDGGGEGRQQRRQWKW